MGKKIFYNVVIIILMFSLATNLFLLFEKSKCTKIIDKQFAYSLSNAGDGFALDFTDTRTYDINQYYYTKAIANICSASRLAPMTTYSKKNDQLSYVLEKLWELLQDNAYEQSVKDNHKELYSDFMVLVNNPYDDIAVNNIIKLVDDLKKPTINSERP